MTEIVSIHCILLIIIPALTSLAVLILGRGEKSSRLIALSGAIVTFILSVEVFIRTQSVVLSCLNNELRMDVLSGVFGLIVGFIGLLVCFYSFHYVSREKIKGIIVNEKKVKSFYWQLMLFMSTMMWAVTTNNILMLWVIIEATTIASGLLVAFYWNKTSLEASYKYMMILTVGISFALFGCILVYSGTAAHVKDVDPLKLTVISSIAQKHLIPGSIVLLAVSFFIMGFGTKAGIAPFHAWLPDAYSEAPVPVAALFSAVMMKIAVYAIIRTVLPFYSMFSIISLFLTGIGLFSMLIGVAMMFKQDDIKRFIAFSSVSQAGYIIMGLGLAGSIISGHSEGSYLAAYGSIFHIINHAIMKSLMFLCAGAVIYATGFRKMSELGGLGKKMPYTSACFFIAVLSISGVPLFNGFMSKISLFLAGAKIPGMLWVTIIAVLCSILTLGVCLRMAYKIFMGAVPKKLSGIEIKEVPAGMLSSMFILAFLCLLFGIFPGLLDPVLNKSANYILGMIKPVGG